MSDRGRPPVFVMRSLGRPGNERDYGVICSCVSPDGEQMALHRPGGTSQALREICDYLDRLGQGWKIVCISTPVTIYRDLQGTRVPGTGGQGISWPEAILLEKVGRVDLWAGPPSSRVPR